MTKIAIVGATGPTGIHLVAELCRHTAAVRVIARDMDKLARLFPDAAVEKRPADILDADATLRAIEGCDLVYDCVGLPGDQMLADDRLLTRSNTCCRDHQDRIAEPVVSATGRWDSKFFSARSANRCHAMDILVRLALASGSELLCAISAQCAACSRYAATFSLPDIQSPKTPYVFRRTASATLAFGSALHNTASSMIRIRKKRLAVSRFRSLLWGSAAGAEGIAC